MHGCSVHVTFLENMVGVSPCKSFSSYHIFIKWLTLIEEHVLTSWVSFKCNLWCLGWVTNTFGWVLQWFWFIGPYLTSRGLYWAHKWWITIGWDEATPTAVTFNNTWSLLWLLSPQLVPVSIWHFGCIFSLHMAWCDCLECSCATEKVCMPRLSLWQLPWQFL